MISENYKQEGQERSMDAERKELQQATRHFVRSMFRTGVSLALLPIKRLPRKPQQHFITAGREFTHGLATLVHEFANGLEEAVKDTTTSANFGENPPSNGEKV